MPLWLVRAGRHGEHEQRFLEDCRVYINWGASLDRNLADLGSQQDLKAFLGEIYPDETSARKLANNAGQLWAFAAKMQPGDWVVLPSKQRSAIHIAEVTGGYEFDADLDECYQHYRSVRWIAQDVPRDNFDQDLLYSFGAFLTICQIWRNDAEARVRAMAANNWEVDRRHAIRITADDGDESDAQELDLEEVAQDQIARLVLARFKGHGMARLVEEILKAQGYTTHRPPEGPDKGIDILAAPGPMGFGSPKLCVQVKSQQSPVDRPTLTQLTGTMHEVGAEHGLLVSWGGFKSTVTREEAVQFFRVRLWDRRALLDQLFENYERLDDEIRAELPLKRVWMLSLPDPEA